jgi:hypothetical protein
MRRLLISILLAIALSCAVFLGDAVYIRHNATVFLQDLKNLDSAEDPTSYFLVLQQKYRKRFMEERCASNTCVDKIVFDNRFLSVFHLAPKCEIRTYFTLEHGSLEMFYMEFTSEISKENSPIVNFQEVFHVYDPVFSKAFFYVNPHGRDATEIENGMVDFARISTPKQKEAALGLNLTCMTKLRGCKDISELLPTMWKRTRPDAVSSRLRSNADSIADGLQPLPDQ